MLTLNDNWARVRGLHTFNHYTFIQLFLYIYIYIYRERERERKNWKERGRRRETEIKRKNEKKSDVRWCLKTRETDSADSVRIPAEPVSFPFYAHPLWERHEISSLPTLTSGQGIVTGMRRLLTEKNWLSNHLGNSSTTSNLPTLKKYATPIITLKMDIGAEHGISEPRSKRYVSTSQLWLKSSGGLVSLTLGGRSV